MNSFDISTMHIPAQVYAKSCDIIIIKRCMQSIFLDYHIQNISKLPFSKVKMKGTTQKNIIMILIVTNSLWPTFLSALFFFWLVAVFCGWTGNCNFYLQRKGNTRLGMNKHTRRSSPPCIMTYSIIGSLYVRLSLER